MIESRVAPHGGAATRKCRNYGARTGRQLRPTDERTYVEEVFFIFFPKPIESQVPAAWLLEQVYLLDSAVAAVEYHNKILATSKFE